MPDASGIPDAFVAVFQLIQSPGQVFADFLGKPGRHELLEFGHRWRDGGQGQRVEGIGVPVNQGLFFKEIGNLPRGDGQPHRGIGVGASFGGGDDIGDDIPVLCRPYRPGAVPAAHHFIRNQQDAVFIADFPQSREIFRWWHHSAVGARYRLNEHRGHIAFFLNHVVHIFGALDITAGIIQPEGASVAVGVRGKADTGQGVSGPLGEPAPRVTGK